MTKSKYVALTAVVKEAISLKPFFDHLDLAPSKKSTTIFSKSTTATIYSKNPRCHGKLNWNDIKYHFVKGKVALEQIELVHIPSLVVD